MEPQAKDYDFKHYLDTGEKILKVDLAEREKNRIKYVVRVVHADGDLAEHECKDFENCILLMRKINKSKNKGTHYNVVPSEGEITNV